MIEAVRGYLLRITAGAFAGAILLAALPKGTPRRVAAMLCGLLMLLLALTPLAERALRIDERDIQTGVEFQAERPRIDARIVCTIRIGQIVVIALAFGVGF